MCVQPIVATGARSAPVRPFEAQLAAAGDRRSLGLYDARFHSTNWCASFFERIFMLVSL